MSKIEENKITKLIIYCILIVIILICGVVIYNKVCINRHVYYEDDYADTGYGTSVKYEPNVIKVDVEGAVKKPGLKTLKGDKDRLDDAIKAAKGFKRFADKDQLNLAMKVYDGMKIVVPEYGQQLIIEGTSQGTGKGFVGKVNVNTATAEELQQIPGIGPSYAQRIIEHRNNYGPFRSPNDLLAIKGIGKKKLAAMKDNLAF